MEKDTRQRLEKAALAGGIVSALGGTAYALARNRQPNPGILNDERFNHDKRELLNKVAVEILCSSMPTRQQLIDRLSIKIDSVKHLIGYLTDYGLVVRHQASVKARTPSYYAPTDALSRALAQPEMYHLLAAARQERENLLPVISDNL